MIEQVIKEMVEKRGLVMPDITLVKGAAVGALDVHLLKLESQGQLATVLIYQHDLDQLAAGEVTRRLDVSLSFALLSLKLKIGYAGSPPTISNESDDFVEQRI